MNSIERLQHWYASQCNDDWEHSFGIKIDTLDNPGWTLTIDLQDTNLQQRRFNPINRGNPEDDTNWLVCNVEDAQFVGACGVHNLDEMLDTFLAWAQA